MKVLSNVLLITGILAASSPLAGELYTHYLQDRMINDWYNTADAGIAESGDRSSVSSADPEEDYIGLRQVFSASTPAEKPAVAPAEVSVPDSTMMSESEPAKPAPEPAKSIPAQTVLGIIRISKINVKLPVVEGVKAENLRVGIGHIPGTAGLGQPGNCALAGHRSYTFGRFFNRLDELTTGDRITLSTKNCEYGYIIYEKLVVKPDDVSILGYDKGDNILTLITCTPIRIASHRLIIHAMLEEKVLLQP